MPVSPKLDWTHAPPGTEVSFALILHDPDAALQKKTDDVLHWMIFNIRDDGLPRRCALEREVGRRLH